MSLTATFKAFKPPISVEIQTSATYVPDELNPSAACVRIEVMLAFTEVSLPFVLALDNAANTTEAKRPMIATTTKSSISVKPLLRSASFAGQTSSCRSLTWLCQAKLRQERSLGAGPGFEPDTGAYETPVLPLHHPAAEKFETRISKFEIFSRRFQLCFVFRASRFEFTSGSISRAEDRFKLARWTEEEQPPLLVWWLITPRLAGAYLGVSRGR